jgi:hypothetical protein
VEPDGVRLQTIGTRLDLDPWVNMQPIDLSPAVETVERSLEQAGIDLEPFDRFRS